MQRVQREYFNPLVTVEVLKFSNIWMLVPLTLKIKDSEILRFWRKSYSISILSVTSDTAQSREEGKKKRMGSEQAQAAVSDGGLFIPVGQGIRVLLERLSNSIHWSLIHLAAHWLFSLFTWHPWREAPVCKGYCHWVQNGWFHLPQKPWYFRRHCCRRIPKGVLYRGQVITSQSQNWQIMTTIVFRIL